VFGHIASKEPQSVPQSVARPATTTALAGVHDQVPPRTGGLPAGDAAVGEPGEIVQFSHVIPPYRFPGGPGEGQAAQHESLDTSRLNACAASFSPSDMVR
jgi:hypothetical protein